MTDRTPPSLDALAETAQQKLSPADWGYLMEGARPGQTGDANVAAWDRLKLRPHVLRGVADADTSTTVLGAKIDTPIFVAPNGRATRFHPEGELAVLRGSAAHGAGALLASSVSASVGALRRHAPEALIWGQVYMAPDRGFMRERIETMRSAGVAALVLTVDLLPDLGAERPPPAPQAAWETPGKAEPAPVFTAAGVSDLEWLCGLAALPIVVKGVLRADDAARCVLAGAAGVIVSNHGGNQLADTIASAEALPEIVDACAGRAEIYVDGGIRSGGAILKALALGARAVMVGRPFSHALAAAGSEGVSGCFKLLTDELKRAMLLCGAARIAGLNRDLIAR